MLHTRLLHPGQIIQWNIQLARCFSEKEFESVYVAWWVDTLISDRSCRLDFWYVYNTVTQLGRWSTVTANNWHYHVHPKLSPEQLSSLYLRYLYDFECAHFRGKRYDTKDEGAKLWSPVGVSLKRKLRDVFPPVDSQMMLVNATTNVVQCGTKARLQASGLY